MRRVCLSIDGCGGLFFVVLRRAQRDRESRWAVDAWASVCVPVSRSTLGQRRARTLPLFRQRFSGPRQSLYLSTHGLFITLIW